MTKDEKPKLLLETYFDELDKLSERLTEWFKPAMETGEQVQNLCSTDWWMLSRQSSMILGQQSHNALGMTGLRTKGNLPMVSAQQSSCNVEAKSQAA